MDGGPVAALRSRSARIAPLSLSPTARRAVGAYGGEARWREAVAVECTFSAWGWAFRLKCQRAFRHAWGRLEVGKLLARIRPLGRAGHIGVLEGDDVRLEDEAGKVVATRQNPRALFPYRRRLLFWDSLDRTYFSGYALWNYMTLPALLLREDIEWRELEEGLLEARFPATIPTHCERQQFHFHLETGFLRLEHATWQGIPFTSKRRVTPRRPNGKPRRGPLLVAIEIHEWRLV